MGSSDRDPGSSRQAPEAVPVVSTHTHTDLSRCGHAEMTYDALLQHATELGYAALVLTDHVHVPWYIDHAAHLQRLAAYRRQRDARPGPVQVLIGGEFEVERPGYVLAPEPFVEACEVAIVAPNHYALEWVTPLPAEPAAAASHELDCIETIIDWPPASVIVHPFTGGGAELPADVLYEAADKGRLRELGARAAAAGVAVEIQPKFWGNARAQRLDEFFEDWLAWGGQVALGSDAHKLASLTTWADAFPAVVERFALTPANVWWPWPPAPEQGATTAV